MGIFHWVTNRFSGRGRALSRYQQGMARARKHDSQGAIVDYTATIDMPNAPADVIAMALYNRALVYVALGNEKAGMADLDLLLAMPGAHANVRTMAKQKLARMELRHHNSDIDSDMAAPEHKT